MKRVGKDERARAKRLAECDGHYTQNNCTNILRSFEIKIDPTGRRQLEFLVSVKRCAWLFFNARAYTVSSPTAQVTILNRLDTKIGNAASELSAAMNDLYLAAHLREAAAATIRRDGEFDAKLVLQKMPTLLERIRLVISETRLKIEIGTGGNRSDEPLHEFIRSVTELYEKTARNPQFPKGARSAGCEFIKFLQACLRPLGIVQSDQALVKTFLRATQA